MKNTVTEMFLTEYFLHTAILDKFDVDSERLFAVLGKMFFLTDKQLDGLYKLVSDSSVKGVATEKDFRQFRRIARYAELSGMERGCTDETEELINIKGNAISRAVALKLKPEGEATRNSVYSALAEAANDGDINAKRILGIWLYEGIFVDVNARAGLKHLSKAADWNDVCSILALLRYCKDKREYNFSRLYTAVAYTPFAGLTDEAVKAYGIDDCEKIPEVKLLERAFLSSVLKRETYNPKYARIIYCHALSYKDKEKIVFNTNKELISTITDLPLKLSEENREQFDQSLFSKLPLKRSDELADIMSALAGSDLRFSNSYKPLLIVSDSYYLQELYAEAFLRNRDIHTERIDVADLKEYDLEPNANNVFVRSVNEHEDNCFLMFFNGEISGGVMARASDFLRSGRREKFHLNAPCVTLDLREVLPVCFADRRNADSLKKLCDVVELADVTDEEKAVAARHILARKKKLYRTLNVSFADDAAEAFAGSGIDAIERAIDDAVRANVRNGGVIIDKALLRKRLGEYGRDKIILGFGGADSENK